MQEELTGEIFEGYGEQGVSRFFTDAVLAGASPERMRRIEPTLHFTPALERGRARQADLPV